MRTVMLETHPYSRQETSAGHEMLTAATDEKSDRILPTSITGNRRANDGTGFLNFCSIRLGV